MINRNHSAVPDRQDGGATASVAVLAALARQHRTRGPQRAASESPVLYTSKLRKFLAIF